MWEHEKILKLLEQIIRKREYKSTECYITILDNCIIGFTARFLPYSPKPEVEVLWENGTFKLYKEIKNVEDVLSWVEK
jgi:hypothetical protein